MTRCKHCLMLTTAANLNANGVCLVCRAGEIRSELIDVDTIIGAHRLVCPTCRSNNKPTRWNVPVENHFGGIFGVRPCADIWHDLPASRPAGSPK